ncbi:MAG: hypothetical protein ABID87_02665 [Chloroflexota bacterium]
MTTVSSAPKARRIVDELKKCGITHFIYLPDDGTRAIIDFVQSDGEMVMIPVCREGEAFAIAAGLITGGKRPVVHIQNTGFLESGDSISGIIISTKQPLLFLVGYRGWQKTPPYRDPAAIYLEPVLKAWGIEYHIVETAADAGKIAGAYRKTQDESRPVALLITREE